MDLERSLEAAGQSSLATMPIHLRVEGIQGVYSLSKLTEYSFGGIAQKASYEEYRKV